jgi:hypothetical protein
LFQNIQINYLFLPLIVTQQMQLQMISNQEKNYIWCLKLSHLSFAINSHKCVCNLMLKLDIQLVGIYFINYHNNHIRCTNKNILFFCEVQLQDDPHLNK